MITHSGTIISLQAIGDLGSFFRLIAVSGPVVKGVLFALLFFSLVSWGIILDKLLLFHRVKRATVQFIDIFRQFDSLEEIFVATAKVQNSPLKNIYQTGFREFKRLVGSSNRASADENKIFQTNSRSIMERELSGAISMEMMRMEKRLPFLATTGSVTPFVGLFGTVLGIMNAFGNIGSASGGASLITVAPGIAEALITTAAGLLAAIPAVIAFNYLVNQIKKQGVTMQRFAVEFMALLET